MWTQKEVLFLNFLIPSAAFWHTRWELAHQTPAASAGAEALMDVDVWKKDKVNFNYEPGLTNNNKSLPSD